ncbi:MAG: peptidylprolyl isomerase [Pseudomonadota bacterium]
MLHNRVLQMGLLAASLAFPAYAVDPQKQVAPVDQIAAVVNDDVITRYELSERVAEANRILRQQGTQLPPADVLEKQVLERAIMEMLQQQFAKENGVRVDDAQLDRAIQRIMEQNKIASQEEFRLRLEREGIDYKKFREDIRREIIGARLREREVDSKLLISDGEIDNYLANQAKQGGKGEEFHLAHILVVVPEQASADQIRARQQRAEEAMHQLQKGANFAQVTAGYSDANDAMQGGDLGWRPSDRMPPAFAEVLRALRPGEVSQIIRSPGGFHILKLIEKRDRNSPVLITQTHVRHILIKTSELVPESEARRRLLEIKQRIENGGDFAEQARRFSQDGSASQGGDLGWISPGDTVTEFQNAMDKLLPGQMSDAVQTGFGWHLIQVVERRNNDVTNEQKRQQARTAIRALKGDEQWQDWLRQLRDRAYIEYREQ